MRVCINKSTGKLIESQSGGDKQKHLNTLLQNAFNVGYKESDIDVKFVTEAEYQTILDLTTVPTDEEIIEKEQEDKIFNKIRSMAIEGLKKEGELPTDYKDMKGKGV